MRSFVKPVIFVLGAVIGFTQVAAKKDEPKKEQKKDAPAKDVKSAEKKDGKTDKASGKKDRSLSLPVPPGHPQKGLKIPMYDSNGKLTMNFHIGTATWIDDENIKLQEMRIEMFKDDGSHDMDMDLPDSVLNNKTQDLTSKVRVNVKRDDFEITGNNMTFNLETRKGSLGGGVKMIIYNLSDETGGQPTEKKAKIEIQPIKEEQK
jgi:hypothetical protein